MLLATARTRLQQQHDDALVVRPGSIEGVWVPPDEESRVTIRRDGSGRFFGHISWLKDTSRAGQLDFRNPRRELRDRKLLGLPILVDFREDAGRRGRAKSLESGKIYDPARGWSVRGKLLLNEETDELRVEGWVGLGPLRVSRSYTWSRFKRTTKD